MSKITWSIYRWFIASFFGLLPVMGLLIVVPQAPKSPLSTNSGVTFAPLTALRSGAAGEAVTQTFYLTNTGEMTDSFNLSVVSTKSWLTTTIVGGQVGSLISDLGAGQTVEVQIAVSIPISATGGESNLVEVQALSANDATVSATVRLTTTVDLVRGIDLQPRTLLGGGSPGVTVQYTLWVTNSGNALDNFDVISSSLAGWSHQIQPTHFGLEQGVSRTVSVSVEIPSGALATEHDFTLVEVSGSGVSATAALTTVVDVVNGIDLSPSIDAGIHNSGCAGYPNIENYKYRKCIVSSVASCWLPYWLASPALSESQIPLSPRSSHAFVVTFTVGSAVVSGTVYSVNITATASANVHATTSIQVMAGVHRIFLPHIVRDWPPRWQQGGIVGQTVYQLAVCPADPQQIYAATDSKGVYRSITSGASWNTTTLMSGLVRGVAVNPDPADPQNCRQLYAFVWGQGILKTVDGGLHWDPATPNQPELYGYALTINAHSPYTMYVGLHSNGVYQSLNGGVVWKSVTGLPNLPVTSLTTAPDGSVYAATYGGGTYRIQGLTASLLGGSTSINQNVLTVAVDPASPNVLYIGTEGGLYRYDGSNWMQKPTGSGRVYSALVSIDQHGTKTVYAGLENNGVWRSTDNGQSFQPFSSSIQGLTVRNVSIGDSAANFIQIGTTDGVWRYPYP